MKFLKKDTSRMAGLYEIGKPFLKDGVPSMVIIMQGSLSDCFTTVNLKNGISGGIYCSLSKLIRTEHNPLCDKAMSDAVIVEDIRDYEVKN